MFTDEEIKILISIFDTTSINELSNLSSMTNKNVLFEVNLEKYIFRRAGKGSSELVNRKSEEIAYNAIKPFNFSDKIIYLNSDNGIKITKYIENSRACDPAKVKDVTRCMTLLKSFHDKKIKTHTFFDLFEMIEKYESLMQKSKYTNYEHVKNQVLKLKSLFPSKDEYCLTHIDPNHDNFLLTPHGTKLIDWEYAAMQDPHVDIAMFAIYAGYTFTEIEELLWIYFNGYPDQKTVDKIYAYVATCGLLWSNWCEYKEKFGLDFGKYAKKQFDYARYYS